MQAHSSVRAAGAGVLASGILVVISTTRRWYEVFGYIGGRTGAGGQILVHRQGDFFQQSASNVIWASGSFKLPLAIVGGTWTLIALAVGAAALVAIGLTTIVGARRIRTHWFALATVFACALVAVGAIGSMIQAFSTLEYVTIVHRGPGEGWALFGTGIGIVAVLALVVQHLHIPRLRTSPRNRQSEFV